VDAETTQEDASLDTSVAPPDGDIVAPGDATDVTAPDVTPPAPQGPGHVVWRRLNRTELGNTWRDLFGSSLGLETDLPADDTGYGFDNIASVLSLSPLHLELLERATYQLAAEATRRPLTTTQTYQLEAEILEMTAQWGGPSGSYMIVASGGDILAPVDLPRAGTWQIDVRAFEQAAGPDHARFAVMANEVLLGTFDVLTTVSSPQIYSLSVALPAGAQTIAVSYINDYVGPTGADRNLGVDWIRVSGPELLEDPSAMPWSRVMTCSDIEVDGADRACADRILRAFTTRAWRRPDLEASATRVVQLFDAAVAAGTPYLEAVALGIQASLLSPQAIFRSEFIQFPNSAKESPLDPWAVASRLSYFLWSTMPDEDLFEAARSGALATPEGITTQVRRMLDDPRAEALTSNFAGQWLYIRDVANIFPDQGVFPEFDEGLRDAMQVELNSFFRSFVTTDRSMLELLTASDTVVNRRLAEHYGLDALLANGVPGDDTFVAHDFGDGARRGILGKAGLMATLSTPFRTSIVRRGKWVLGQLLCSEPRAPPPGVEGLIEVPIPGEGPMTLREKMERHKTDPTCVSCHQSMDPIGFALENYDGIGAWRDTEGGRPIDNLGELSGGRVFHGPGELADILAADARLPGCMAEKLFIYAVGRGIRVEDDESLGVIAEAFAASGHKFEALVTAIATSNAFVAQEGQLP